MYVTPKSDCPHVNMDKYLNLEEFKKIEFTTKTCKNCSETSENWVCLTCGDLFCSRYINSHFLAHHTENNDHSICLSMMDLSFWCYDCESYIVNRYINQYYRIVSDCKFGKNFRPTVSDVTHAMEYLNLDEKKVSDIKYSNFIELLKSGKFKKISFMTGAGISTSAGIPDFRSSENGIFKEIQKKYNLSQPEDFFSIGFFKDKPECFYEWAKNFDIGQFKATPTHWFMSFLHYKGMVNLIFTQNIDSLELDAKIPTEKIIFAHGHFKEAHCPGCKKEYNIELLQSHIKEGKVLFCTEPDCKTPCKPKVVFYGESLPGKFFDSLDQLKDSDLAFVMGTSLKVMPFSYLPFQISKDAWRIVVNREKVGHEGAKGFKYDDLTSQDVFLEGTTDDFILKIIKDCGWKDEFEEYIASNSN